MSGARRNNGTLASVAKDVQRTILVTCHNHITFIPFPFNGRRWQLTPRLGLSLVASGARVLNASTLPHKPFDVVRRQSPSSVCGPEVAIL